MGWILYIWNTMLNELKRILGFKEPGETSDDDGPANYLKREKVIVFAISFVLAFCLWFIVNLSRDHNITVNLPIEIGNLPADMALGEEIANYVSASVSGEGWQLISIYNNPPSVTIDAMENDINLYEKVQQQMMGMPGINVTNVQPIVLRINLEEKSSKLVPVDLVTDIQLRDRYDLTGEPLLAPDSVLISGAVSKIEYIDSVQTYPFELTGVDEDLQLTLELMPPDAGVAVDPSAVQYTMSVAEFTEGEMRIPVQIRNLPPGRAITSDPSTVTVRYRVPIDQYSGVQDTRPFEAYVDYETIESDTTGIVIPQIEATTEEFDVRLRSFQPGTVSYFNIIQQD